MAKGVDVKTMTIDLAKTLSYLTQLENSKDQIYVTKEGVALLEGVVLGGNDKVKVMPKDTFDDKVKECSDKLTTTINDYEKELETLRKELKFLRSKKKGFLF